MNYTFRAVAALVLVAGCGSGCGSGSAGGAGTGGARSPDGGSSAGAGIAGAGVAGAGVAGTGASGAGAGGAGEGGAGAGGAGAGGAGAGGAGEGGAGGVGGAGSGGEGANMCLGGSPGGSNDRVKLALGAVESPDPNPPQKDESAYANLAYDTQRGVMLMFGGQTFERQPARTWRWDGTVFTELASAAASPTPRTSFAMVYDAGRGRVVLFGGRAANGEMLSDVWEWDGQRWAQVPASNPPPARAEHALAYDAARGRTVLFGGTGADRAQLDDTWEWDGTTWRDATPAGTRPMARRHHAMAYDPVRARTLLLGGDREAARDQAILERDAWEWDGQSWQRAYFSTDGGSTCNGRTCMWPRGGAHVVMAYDATLGGIVAYSGTIWSHIPYMGAGTPDADRRDVEARQFWLWRGQAWTELTADGDWPSAEAYQYFPSTNIFPSEPPEVHHWGFAYDDCRRRVVLFRHARHEFAGARVNEVEARFSPNQAPTLQYPGTPGARQVYPGRTLSFSVQGSDADLDILAFSTGALPSGASARQDGPTGHPSHMTFNWTTLPGQAGEYSVDFHVTDGLATADLAVPIHVGPIAYPGFPSGAIAASGTLDFTLRQIEKRWDLNGTTVIGEIDEGPAPSRVDCELTGNNPGELALRCSLFVDAQPGPAGQHADVMVADVAPLPIPEGLGTQSFSHTPSSVDASWAAGLVANPDGTITLTLGNFDVHTGSSLSWEGGPAVTLRLTP